MMMTKRPGRGGLVWALLGGLVLLAGIVAIVVGGLFSQPAPPPGDGPTSPAPSGSSIPSAPTAPGGAVVDPAATDKGWTPEPVTTNSDLYIRAALQAASTFDTTLSSREEWLDYLDSWFTPDSRYETQTDRDTNMAASQVEMRQGVVLPEEEWDSLASEDGRVLASATGDVTFVPVSEDASGDMSIGTADIDLTFTRSDGSGSETSYEETVRVSVQVLCGDESVPTPGTAQQAGDCKVVRYFTEPLEP